MIKPIYDEYGCFTEDASKSLCIICDEIFQIVFKELQNKFGYSLKPEDLRKLIMELSWLLVLKTKHFISSNAKQANSNNPLVK